METQKTHVEVEKELFWTETTPITTTTRSCSKHRSSHQRQPRISEELLRTLQQSASGPSTGARASSDSRGGYPRVGPEGPGQPARRSLQCHRFRTACARWCRAALVSFNSTNLVSCWFAAYTRRSPSMIKNVCILNNSLHK